MDTALKEALNRSDVDDILLSAIEHADARMRRYVWRGLKRTVISRDEEFIAGDKTAKDFVNEALRRLCDGRRTYNPERGLLENLNSTTDSLISSEKKSSDRTPIIDFIETQDETGVPCDPILRAPCKNPTPDANLVEKEDAEFQLACFKQIRASFDGDKETQDYLDALSEGFFEINEISELTSIPAAKIYEIRRKLKKIVPRIFGTTTFEALDRKVEEAKR